MSVPVSDWKTAYLNAMLAPLKDRSILEVDEGVRTTDSSPCTLKRENQDLRQALRNSRQRLRQGAWESTRQISRLSAEVSRLQTLCARYESQMDRYASSVALIELGQALMRISEENERLREGAHRAWLLEKTLVTAHREYQTLAAERDALAVQLHQSKLDQSSGQPLGGL